MKKTKCAWKKSIFVGTNNYRFFSYLLIAKIVKMHNGLHRYVSLVVIETIKKHVWIVSFVVPLIMYGLPSPNYGLPLLFL
jgi:hypothetical protein